MSPAKRPYRWAIAEQDRPRVKALADAAKVPPLIAHLLLLRGIDTPEAASVFLRPALGHLTDPFSFTGMRAAVDRLTQARNAGERVLIFGDYDVDGVTGTAILIHGFRRFGLENFTYGMPLRLSEGYGMNPEHVEAAHADGVSLIVTVDNGVSAHEAARRARELGIDLIVTDHHSLDGGLPEAVAVINPKQDPEAHAGHHLSGAGVAFKLSAALNGTPNDLDIAAVGTVADIVPLQGENRTIVALGIRHMTKHQRNGLAKLAKQSGFDLPQVTSERIGFQLGPRINAAGRLDDGLAALKLLMAECPLEAEALARGLDAANAERRAIEAAIYEEAVQELEACFTPEKRSIVLARHGWHSGVIGIVASRVESRYHRPTIIIAIDDDGVARGSARSVTAFDMVGALTACGGWLEKFGGHRAAAGMTVLEDRIAGFAEAFEQEALRRLGAGEITRELAIDATAAFSQIDAELLNALQLLEPLGHGNPSPLFCSPGVEIVPQSVRVLKDRHLKMLVRQQDRAFSAIGFGMAERFYTDALEGRVDLAYTPKFNTYQGETSIQLELKDIRTA